MIRLTYLLRRKRGTTRSDFQQYWSEFHGPLVASYARILGMLRYVQVYTLEQEYSKELAGARGKMEAPYDGVEELWWNSRENLITALDSTPGQTAAAELLEDEKEFINLPKSPLWFNYEYPQVNPSPENILATDSNSLIKLYFVFRPLPSLPLEKAQLYWRTSHGPLIRKIAESGHIKRYIQVHRYEEDLEKQFRKTRGTVTERYGGHAELWYDWRDLLSPVNSPERVRGIQLAIEDERKFIDFTRSSMWLSKERLFVDRR